MDSGGGTAHARWVAPFGDPRIEARSRLPGAYRSVPRPSSPLGAKASAGCPSLARPAPAAAPPPHRGRGRDVHTTTRQEGDASHERRTSGRRRRRASAPVDDKTSDQGKTRKAEERSIIDDRAGPS